jgi:hypothetical protein
MISLTGWIRRHSALLLLAGAVGAVAAVGGITAAFADIPDAGVIHGCYKTTTPHVLSVIDTSKGQACPPGTKALAWNQAGPPGPAGPGYYIQPTYAPGSAQDVAPGHMVTVTANCPAISGTPGYATGGGVVTYDGPAASSPPLHAPDLRMIDSYPYPGSSARNYNTGWTATVTNASSSQTESFQTWAMCLYPAS